MTWLGTRHAAAALGMCAGVWLLFTLPVRAEPNDARASEPGVAHDEPTTAAARRGARPDCPELADNPFDEAAAVGKAVDLNTADESALLDLPGIGPARARAILAYRSAHGRFRSISQLLQIRGIGRALLKQLRPLITLTEAAR
ncbi:MAG: hypothetical protein RLZZ450_5777 [Pseudomonadota bacterium]|jgi:competence ComEA-like helix-hairpin-helix protein